MPAPQSTTPTVESAPDGATRFTLDQANRALTYVRRVVDDVVDVYARIVELRRRLEDMGAGDEAAELERQYEYAMDRLGDLVDELHLVGVELKDFERGLVDFPAIHADQPIILCWAHGQPSITHWHAPDAGYDDRRPVEALAA